MWCRNAREDGYVRTLSGRRRELSDIVSSDSSKRSYAERQAVNSVVQGSASDIIKLAMIEMHTQLHRMHADSSGYTANLILQIHDELVYDVPLSLMSAQYLNVTGSIGEFAVATSAMSDSRPFVALLREVMEKRVSSIFGITVPVLVNIRVGNSWGDL